MIVDQLYTNKTPCEDSVVNKKIRSHFWHKNKLVPIIKLTGVLPEPKSYYLNFKKTEPFNPNSRTHLRELINSPALDIIATILKWRYFDLIFLRSIVNHRFKKSSGLAIAYPIKEIISDLDICEDTLKNYQNRHVNKFKTVSIICKVGRPTTYRFRKSFIESLLNVYKELSQLDYFYPIIKNKDSNYVDNYKIPSSYVDRVLVKYDYFDVLESSLFSRGIIKSPTIAKKIKNIYIKYIFIFKASNTRARDKLKESANKHQESVSSTYKTYEKSNRSHFNPVDNFNEIISTDYVPHEELIDLARSRGISFDVLCYSIHKMIAFVRRRQIKRIDWDTYAMDWVMRERQQQNPKSYLKSGMSYDDERRIYHAEGVSFNKINLGNKINSKSKSIGNQEYYASRILSMSTSSLNDIQYPRDSDIFSLNSSGILTRMNRVSTMQERIMSNENNEEVSEFIDYLSNSVDGDDVKQKYKNEKLTYDYVAINQELSSAKINYGFNYSNALSKPSGPIKDEKTIRKEHLLSIPESEAYLKLNGLDLYDWIRLAYERDGPIENTTSNTIYQTNLPNHANPVINAKHWQD